MNERSRGDEHALTPEEISLLETPDEKLRANTMVFSFDHQEMCERVKAGVSWQQIIQGHLYLDHAITQLLEEALVNPDALTIERLDFSRKLQLVDALGLADRDLLHLTKIINGIRNKIAHRLTFEVSDKIEDDIRAHTPERIKQSAIEIMKADRDKPQIFVLVIGLILALEVRRQQNAFWRVRDKKSDIDLRITMAEVQKTLTIDRRQFKRP